jgi:lambda family phage tail tape measure protein
MIVGDLEIRLRSDIARLQRDMDRMRRETTGALNRIDRAASATKAALSAVAGALSFGVLIREVVSAQREFDKLNATLVTATGSSANAAQAFKALQAFAATTPYSLKEATEGFIKMRNMGLDPSERALRSYGNTSAAMGKDLQQMIEAVADAATGEFERLKEFGIKAKQNGDVVSLTFQGVTTSIGNNAKEIEGYLQRIGEVNFGGGMELRAATLDGAISNLGDTWQATLRMIAQNGIGDAAQSGVLSLTAALTDLSAILDAVAGAANREGKAVAESAPLHRALTTIFETVAVLGSQVYYVLESVGREIGGLGAQIMAIQNAQLAFWTGDFKGALAGIKDVGKIGDMMKSDAEEARIAIDAKMEAILGASAKAIKATADEAAAKKASGRDDLAQYKTVQSASEKAAELERKHSEFRTKFATREMQLATELAKYRKELGSSFTAADEALVRAKFADKSAGTQEKQIGKGQLSYDVEEIKRSSAAAISVYTSAEQIMEAVRGAGLISEEDYYTSKLGFINLTASAQEKALQDEIARLQQETLIGKDKIDNDRKIMIAGAELDKARADAVVARTINSIQEAAAIKRIEQSYIDAQVAAKTYLDTVALQNAREIAGIGKGTQVREFQSGINRIEDRQTTTRQGLEGDLSRKQITRAQYDAGLAIANDTYAKEVAAYGKKTDDIKAKEADWLNGATEAFANYQTAAEKVSVSSAAAFTTAFEGMTDGVSSSITASILHAQSFEESMKAVALNVVEAFIQAFIKIAIQQLFTQNAMTLATLAGVTARGGVEATGAATSLALSAATAEKSIMMSAWETMASAYKAIAGIPIVGPFLAPVAAGAAFIAVSSLAKNIASAEGGYDIPAGVNPMTQLHEQEMVLPKQQANVIRDLAKDGGTKSGAITIINQTSARIGKVTETKLSNGDRALIIQEATQSAVAATSSQMADPNSQTSRSMARNFAIPRSR